MLRYSASFINWTRDELRVLDRRTRKHLTMYGAIHSRDSVARLHIPRKNGGRGLISVEDCVDQAVIGLSSYIAQSDDKLLSAAQGDSKRSQETSKDFRKRRYEERMNEEKEKQLHRQFFREMEGVASDKSWGWLGKVSLKEKY